jgi:hypothetical protein
MNVTEKPMGIVKVEIQIGEEAAVGLAVPKRLEAGGRLVDHMQRSTAEQNQLAALCDATGPAAEQTQRTSIGSWPLGRRDRPHNASCRRH